MASINAAGANMVGATARIAPDRARESRLANHVTERIDHEANPGRSQGISGQEASVCSVDTGATRWCMIHTMKSVDLVRELKAAGWVLDRVRGSHHVFRHPTRPGHVVVPHPKKDLGAGLVAAIRKQAGL